MDDALQIHINIIFVCNTTSGIISTIYDIPTRVYKQNQMVAMLLINLVHKLFIIWQLI